VLLNLVSNAVRYTRSGGVVIGCRRRGAYVRIDVCDTGPGIPEGEHDNIFGEYYQLPISAADKRSSAGFGLGLAIVDRLATLLGHPVEVNSSVGRGSRFSVLVPVVPRKASSETDAAIGPGTDPARGKLIVVIDDDALVLDGMAGLLRGWGSTVVSGETVEAVLARISEAGRLPDLIISDYRLAGSMTGIDVIERLRAALCAQIPAFLISGDTAPERLRDAGDKGFHLLHKPVPPLRLRAIVNQLLKSRASTLSR
jgi:two-component system, sensor histidine kinase